MDTITRVQILNLADCVSHNSNTFGKDMNPIVLPPALVRQTVEKKNSEFKPEKFH